MGGFLSMFTAPDTPNPVTGLTNKEVGLIQASWKHAMTDPVAFGTVVLIKFFEKHPEDLLRFPFKDLPRSEMKENKTFQAHGAAVIYSLASVVDNLKNVEVIEVLLKKVGRSHKTRNVGKVQFENLNEVILGILEGIVNKETVVAWKKMLAVAVTVMTSE